MDMILKHYWVQKDTPIWKSHLTSILYGFLAIPFVAIIAEITSMISILIMAVVIVTLTYALTYWARARFGEIDPAMNKDDSK